METTDAVAEVSAGGQERDHKRDAGSDAEEIHPDESDSSVSNVVDETEGTQLHLLC